MAEGTRSLSTICLVDKPAGPTSHDVVAAVRRRLPGRTKVGHTGTLDPFATGLLVLAIGQATRIVRFLSGVDKTYRARIALGATSVTGDPEGPVIATGRTLPTTERIVAAISALNGPHRQTVPAYSAVKVDGERLYARARRGDEVTRPSRDIVIRDAAVTGMDPGAEWVDVTLSCTSGTYVRQIAVDLGDELGCGGYCAELRRTHVGSVCVDDAVSADNAPAQGRMTMAQALSDCMPVQSVDAAEATALGYGQSIAGDADGTLAVTLGDDVVAVVEPDGVGRLRPVVVLQ